ncbi:MAG: ABC transporter permease [Lentisphaerota bacterium]
MKSSTFSPFRLILLLMGGIVMLFILAPLISMGLNSHASALIETAKEKEVYESIWLTLWTSVLVTFLFSIVAVPFSYLLARTNFRFKKLFCVLIDIPVMIPHSAAGIAILGIVARGSPVGSFCSNYLGLNFVDHPAGIMIAMAFISLPYLINAAKDGFEAVPVQLEKAAYTLGVSPAKVFFKISLPLAWRAILSGFVMMWGRGLSEFGAVVIIAYHPMVTSVLIYDRFNTFGLKYAQPVSVLFIIICMMVFILFRMLSGKVKSRSEYSRYG